MNYYNRYPGDYARDTGHLTLAEHGAYTLMLDTCYSTSKPLPNCVQSVYRICRANGRAEKRAVDAVLAQFWTLTDEGYVNERVMQELEKQEPRINAARENGSKGGRPKKTQRVSSGLNGKNPAETQSESSPTPTPVSKSKEDLDRSFDEWWLRYPRKEAKPHAEKAWRKLNAVDRAAALYALGSWPFPDDRKFTPLPASWLNARRWEDETPQREQQAWR